MSRIISLCIFITFSLFISSLATDTRRPNSNDNLIQNTDLPLISTEDKALFCFNAIGESLSKIGSGINTVSDDLSSILTTTQKILARTINVTITPSKYKNISGLKFTTQQLSSIFPRMKGIYPPQNVSFNIVTKINPFHLLNFTDGHLSVNFHAQVGVLLPGMSVNNPLTKGNVTGYVTLKFIPIARGLRLYIADYMVNGFEIANEEKANVNEKQALEFINTVGQLYVDKGNEILGKKL